MFAAQVSWSHTFGRVPAMVNIRGQQWVPRPDEVIEFWDDELRAVARCATVPVGRAYDVYAVALTRDGSLLPGDTIAGGLDPAWVSFQRDFTRNVPMSAAVVQRLIASLEPVEFDRLYTLGGDTIDHVHMILCVARPGGTSVG